MKFSFAIAVCIFFAGCANSQNNNVKIPAGIKQKPTTPEAVAYFSEGCFWHTEIVFQSLEGVRDAISGYAGGTDTNPDYEKVSSGETGHAETVQVYYDPAKISFETLVKAFFASHDPTELNYQGNDAGTQYRSIAFYSNEKEKQVIEAELKKVADSKKYSGKIVTEVKSFTKFYPAEDYHQEYVLNHPNQPYVAGVSIPDYLRFRKEFKEGKFKSL
jgi:peptide-methionine (S)-S-oxide reductase